MIITGSFYRGSPEVCPTIHLHDDASVWVQVTSKQGIDVKRSPSLPFMTSSMLTAAANQLGSDVARTMANAQVLFEGGEVGQSCFLSKTKTLCFSAVIAGAS